MSCIWNWTIIYKSIFEHKDCISVKAYFISSAGLWVNLLRVIFKSRFCWLDVFIPVNSKHIHYSGLTHSYCHQKLNNMSYSSLKMRHSHRFRYTFYPTSLLKCDIPFSLSARVVYCRPLQRKQTSGKFHGTATHRC